MSSEARFVAALLEDPDDRVTPLVFADWLEERGNPRGEFLRVQTELAGWVPDLHRRTELQTRQRQLLADQEAEWLGPLRGVCDEVRWQDGMAHLTVPASRFAGREFTRAARAGWSRAWVRSVRLERAWECVDALAGSPNLGLVTSL